MGNQQPRPKLRNLKILCMNAKFGDGYYWKHPECSNYKLIWTSINPELLELKRGMCPDIFKSGVAFVNLANAAGRFKNAKPLYRLASLTHPIITKYRNISMCELIGSLTLVDMGLWYLDDGSTISRRDSDYGYTRSFLCVGSKLSTPELEDIFLGKMRVLFNTENVGQIRLNGSTATDNNKIWAISTEVAEKLLLKASKYGIMKHKFPTWVRFRDHSHGEVESKGKSTRSARALGVQPKA